MEVLSPLLPLAQREGPSSTPWPVATVSQTTGVPSDRELVARAASGRDQAIGQLYDRYGRRWDLALSHYNGGSLARSRSGRLRAHSYTRRYVERVLAFERQYRDALPRLTGLAGLAGPAGPAGLAGESGVAAPQIPPAAVHREHALGWNIHLTPGRHSI